MEREERERIFDDIREQLDDRWGVFDFSFDDLDDPSERRQRTLEYYYDNYFVSVVVEGRVDNWHDEGDWDTPPSDRGTLHLSVLSVDVLDEEANEYVLQEENVHELDFDQKY